LSNEESGAMNIMRMKRTGFAAVAVAAGLAATGCGSSDDGGGDSASSGSTGDASFKAVAAPETAEPKGLLLTEPLSKVPPKGKTIGYVAGSLPLYSYYAKTLKTAAAKLGWNVKTFMSADPAAGVTQAVNAKVDYIWGQSLTKQQIVTPLKAAKAAKIPFINLGVPEGDDPALGYMTTSRNNVARSEHMIDWIVNDSKGKATIALFTIRSLPYFDPAEKAMKARLKQQCPSCKIKVVDVTLNELATSGVPAKAVSTLQSNPDTTYAAFAYGDMMINVANTVKAAGLLDKTKLVCVDSVTTSLLKEIEKGDVAASGVAPNAATPWWMVDVLARMSVGDDYQVSLRATPPEGESTIPVKDWIVAGPEAAKATPRDEYGWNGPNGFGEEFAKLWNPAAAR
jgi:ribose transport system substrate-binding protein